MAVFPTGLKTFCHSLLIGLFCSSSFAGGLQPDSFSIGYGRETGNPLLNAEDIRLATRWQLIDYVFAKRFWRAEGDLEASFNQWNSFLDQQKASSYGSESISAVMLLPTLRISRSYKKTLPYFEAGLGFGFMSGKALKKNANSPVDKSSRYNFEVMLGSGSRFGANQQYDINLRWYHYSNANIRTPNESLEFVVLGFGYWL